jgi:glycosyltransferase involved in cell wall biosynthesis
MRRHWIILAEGTRRRWGGDLRRYYLFEALAARTNATIVGTWGARSVTPLLPRRKRILPWLRPRIATVEFLEPSLVDQIVHRATPTILDVHDDIVLQADAMGWSLEPDVRLRHEDRKRRNVGAFPTLTAPSAAFAELAGLDRSRVIVAGNGTDTDIVRPEPWPSAPAIGMISGAAPGRGIELLVAAARLAREQVPELRLLLWLVATEPAGETYLADLEARLSADPWIEIGSAPYDEIGVRLGRATIHCVPNVAHPYWESVSPIKLFDDMASGRPTVVTPRAEMARIIEGSEAGVVADGDRPEDLAASFCRLFNDEALAQRLGANARRAAVADYDWRVISSRLAETVLGR